MEKQAYAVILSEQPVPVQTWVASFEELESNVLAARRDRDGGATAAAALAEMAGKYMAGQKLAALFGALHSDIAGMIENAVQRIAAYIDQALEQNTVGAAQAEVSACATLLVEWENNPKQVYRLQEAITHSLEAIRQMQRYGWRQSEAVSDGFSLRILALAAAYKIDHAEKVNLINFYNSSLMAAHTYIEDGRRYFQSLIDNIGPIWHGDCHSSGANPHHDGDPVVKCKYSFTDNGEEHSIDNAVSGDALVALRNEIIANRVAQKDRFVNWATDQLSIRQAEWIKSLPK